MIAEAVTGTLDNAKVAPRTTSRPSTSATPSGSCSPARVSWAPCPPRSNLRSGACPPPGTRPPARRAASPCWRPWPTSRPAATTACWSSASSRSATCRARKRAKHLGAAAWIGHEGQDAKFMWPYMFSQLADEYDRRYGLDDTAPHAIAELNFATPRRTRSRRPGTGPSARAASPPTTHDNPLVEGRLRRTDCSQVTDGAAGVLLGLRPLPREPPRPDQLARDRRLGPPHRRPGAAAQARPQPGRAATSSRTCGRRHDAFRRARLAASRDSTASRPTTASR